MQFNQQQYLTEIVIQKERQKQRDQKVREQQKYSRKQFYTNRIRHKLKEGGATEKEQQIIYQLFIRKDTDQKIHVHSYQLGRLQMFYDLVQSLESEYNTIQQQSKRRLKECEPIANIINLKCSTLKTIVIQYKQKMMFGNPISAYSITAFVLIKVINSNQNLSQVTLKGVQVQKFQEFISLLYKIKNNQSQNQVSEQQRWIKDFQPSKSLKLAISCKCLYNLNNKQNTASLLKHLAYFLQFIQCLSDIIAQVQLGNWVKINEWGNVLQHLWKQLRLIKKLNLFINAQNHIPKKTISLVRTLIFGGITTFTELVQLLFLGIQFSYQASINDLLAMEQILRTIFQNNPIHHLKLYNDVNFPNLPKIKTLQTVEITDCRFGKKNNLMGEIVENNSLLKSMKFYKVMQINGIIVGVIIGISTSISSISSKFQFFGIAKKLFGTLKANNPQIQGTLAQTIENISSLQLLFPKLINLTYLQLYCVNIQAQIICTISSPHLEELHLANNDSITNQGLRQLDSNWPLLRNMTIRNCTRINEMAWSDCQFKGLIRLKIDSRMLGKGKKALSILKNKGIKVFY